MRKAPLILILAWLTLKGGAQDYHKIDSLQRELQKFESRKKQMGAAANPLMDSAKANMWYELLKLNIYGITHVDSAMDYAKQCLSLSEKIGYYRGIGLAYNGMGLVYMYKRDDTQAMVFYQKALTIRQKMDDKDGMAWTHNNMGLAYGDMGNYPMSILNHSLALKIREEMGDKEGMEISFSKRANAYAVLGDYPNALKDYFGALKAADEAGSKVRIMADYDDVGRVYDKMGDYPEALKNYLISSKIALEINDSVFMAQMYMSLGDVCYKLRDYPGALKNYQASLKVKEQFDFNKFGIADVYHKLGQVNVAQGNYADALKNALAALQIFEKIDSKYGMAVSYNLLVQIYEKEGNLREALKDQTKSLALAKEADAKDVKQSAYESLANLNAKLKNYKAAYENEVLFKQTYDSVYNKENERKITGLQMQFEFNRQQDSVNTAQVKKDAVVQQQMQRQKAYTRIGIAGFILLAALLFFVYRSYIYQRKATAAMALAKVRAEQSEKFKEKFLANMSHEIRTPMNAGPGMANLVLETPLTDKQKSYVSGIKKSSENLLVILNDILDLSKLEAGKMQLEKLPFNLREQVNHVMDIMRFKADEKDLLFTLEIADDIPLVIIGDAVRLTEILLNLLGNAIKFTQKGSVGLSVSSRLSADGTQSDLQFSIKDTGIGISQEQQQKIFESFVQGDSEISRKYGGTGLGLAISKTLIELQGGTIHVKSEPHKASEFIFNIPYAVGSETDIVKAEPKTGRDYSALAKLKILIVEDNDFNQVVIKDTLENLAPGITTAIAANGKIAVEMVQRSYYDLILMDVHMPEMDGYEATRIIRNELKMNIPIVALTASVIRGDLDKCIKAGMNGYIPKPFKHTELLNELMKNTPGKTT